MYEQNKKESKKILYTNNIHNSSLQFSLIP